MKPKLKTQDSDDYVNAEQGQQLEKWQLGLQWGHCQQGKRVDVNKQKDIDDEDNVDDVNDNNNTYKDEWLHEDIDIDNLLGGWTETTVGALGGWNCPNLHLV